MPRFTRADVIDTVWSTAADGDWHSRRSLIDHMFFDAQETLAALDFLVRYGFAESSTLGEDWFRVVTDGPSPTEAAMILQAVDEKGRFGPNRIGQNAHAVRGLF